MEENTTETLEFPMSDEQVKLVLWLLEEAGFSREEIYYGHKAFLEEEIDFYRGKGFYVFDIPLCKEEEEGKDEWDLYYGKWQRRRCYLDRTDLTPEERKWFYKHAKILKDCKQLSEEQSYEFLIHLFSLAMYHMQTHTNSQKVSIYFILLDYFQKNPKEILAFKEVSEEEFLHILNEESYELDFIVSRKVPLNSLRAKEYISGLQQRALTWKEAAPIFNMEEANKISFPQIKSAAKKAMENVDEEEDKLQENERFVVYLYDEENELINVFSSAAEARNSLKLKKEEYPLLLNAKYPLSFGTLVKVIEEEKN